MHILSLSDSLVPFIYSTAVRTRFQSVDFILGCGDLPYYYLEYVYNALDTPLFFVRGNHDHIIEYSTAGQRASPHGGIDLHRRAIRHHGVLLAGIEGSARYRPGPFQYSQAEMWEHVLWLAPRLLLNRALYGRALDIFISHAPPVGIHEGPDYPHRGVVAFRWLLRVFRPALHFHGHVHIYSPKQRSETIFGSTRVINAFGWKEVKQEVGK